MRANVKRIREARGFSYRQLSDLLEELGRPIPTLGLSRIEKGERRVDADDLVAIAVALGVNPSALLLPVDVGPYDVLDVTGAGAVTAEEAWNWLDGSEVELLMTVFDEEAMTRGRLLYETKRRFELLGRPHWLVEGQRWLDDEPEVGET